jgi:hypothetical protein
VEYVEVDILHRWPVLICIMSATKKRLNRNCGLIIGTQLAVVDYHNIIFIRDLEGEY